MKTVVISLFCLGVSGSAAVAQSPWTAPPAWMQVQQQNMQRYGQPYPPAPDPAYQEFRTTPTPQLPPASDDPYTPEMQTPFQPPGRFDQFGPNR